MAYLFSSESVSEGHPDKVADQISDALLDQFLAYDEDARCAIETFNTTGQVVIMGEVRSKEYVDLQTIARKTINKIGYTKAEYQFDGNSCGVLSAIHEQSDDINRGVDNGDAENQGAGASSAVGSMVVTAPVRLIFFCVPVPSTTTSSRASMLGCKTIFMRSCAKLTFSLCSL